MTQPVRPPPWLIYVTIIIFLIIFSVTVTVSIIEKDWTAVTLVTPEILIILGYLFGSQIIRGGNNGN